MKTNDVLKVSVLLYTPRSDRKIIDRILGKYSCVVTVLAWKNFLLG